MRAFVVALLLASCTSLSLNAHFIMHDGTNRIRVANLTSGISYTVDSSLLVPTDAIAGIWRLTPCASLVVETEPGPDNWNPRANITVVDVCEETIISRVPVAALPPVAPGLGPYWSRTMYGNGVLYVPWAYGNANTTVGLVINMFNATTGHVHGAVAFAPNFPAPQLLFIVMYEDMIYAVQMFDRPWLGMLNVTSGQNKALSLVGSFNAIGIYYDTVHKRVLLNKDVTSLVAVDLDTRLTRDVLSFGKKYSSFEGIFTAPPGYLLFPVWDIASQAAYDATFNESTEVIQLPTRNYQVPSLGPYWCGAAAWA